MASNSKGKGKGVAILFVLGVTAIGFSNAGWGSPASTTAGANGGSIGDGTEGSEPAGCDGVGIVETGSGPATVPMADHALSAPTSDCVLDPNEGDPGAVAVVQEALARCNGQAVTADGSYGPVTAAAVTAVQQQAGIAADGVYGPTTRDAMAWPTADGSCVSLASGATDSAATLPVTG